MDGRMAEIVLRRHIAAPPSLVYQYLTDSDKWARWQGVGATVDSSTGGVFTIRMPNGASSRGQFVELEPNRRIVFTWGWIDHPGVPPGSTRVEIVLDEQGDETLLTLTHSGLPDSEVPLHQSGWNHYLPRLAAVAEGRDPGPDTGLGGN